MKDKIRLLMLEEIIKRAMLIGSEINPHFLDIVIFGGELNDRE